MRGGRREVAVARYHLLDKQTAGRKSRLLARRPQPGSRRAVRIALVIDWFVVVRPAHGSARSLASRSGTVRTVRSLSGPPSSRHDSGTDTGAPGRPRAEYAATAVAPRPLRRQSRYMLAWRAALAELTVKASGRRRARSLEIARANAFISSHPCRRASGTTTCRPLPPVVFTKLTRSRCSSRSRTARAAL